MEQLPSGSVRNLPTFAWNSVEAFAFPIDVQLFVRELTTMLMKTVDWKIFKCMELVSDSERTTICSWKWSICSFDCCVLKRYRIELSVILFLRCKERHEHAPKVEFLGSKPAFKEESSFLIATMRWRLLILEQEMMDMSFIWIKRSINQLMIVTGRIYWWKYVVFAGL